MYRKGGISAFLADFFSEEWGLTLGKNVFVSTDKNRRLLHHENYHIWQQEENGSDKFGWANLYYKLVQYYLVLKFHNNPFDKAADSHAEDIVPAYY